MNYERLYVDAIGRAMGRRNREERDRWANPPKLLPCRVCRQPGRHSNPFRGVECDEHYDEAERAEKDAYLRQQAEATRKRTA